ncbi:MAG: SGNH/GDSL hydrolase family protein [Deltaproteobacteria bacterium]|nr:SGNH/GDSL hydrolase family protein [Candidatus Zymogenaceae bacterium]
MKKKVLIILLVIIVCLVGLSVGVYRYVYGLAQEKPDNDPCAFIAEVKPGFSGDVLVCVGDSITHGRVSENYVDMLSADLGKKGFYVVNAGINGELAYNVLMRIDPIIACDPDYVTIFIGTNDAHGALTTEQGEKIVKEMKLPQMPTDQWYRENLTQVVKKLKESTHADIALLSIPPIGENPADAAFGQSERYNAIIRDVAEKERVSYLGLFEAMAAYLANHPHAAPPYTQGAFEWAMYSGFARHFLLGASFADVSRKNGFLLETDYLHLNETGARMVADLVEGFVLKGSR